MYLNQYWKDERLAFSNNDEVLTLSGDFAEKIWVPDTFFANDKNRYHIIFLYLRSWVETIDSVHIQDMDSLNHKTCVLNLPIKLSNV